MVDFAPVNIDHNWKYVTVVQKRLLEAVNSQAPTFEEIDSLISQMRLACEAVIFFDFPYATKVNCEKHLWDAHLAINSRYRKLVEAYKKGDQKHHTVERRKLEKRYADFIKTAQYFYKSFIQRLASQYKTNFGLRRIAHRLSLETLTVDERVATSPEVEQKLELSCYTTLLRLGDLSRYRNNLRTKERSWAAAVAYYRLAHDLRPNLGSAHNQLAVVAILEGNHLDAVYHIYRAFTAIEPLKDKETNLEVEFNKIITSFEKGKHASQIKLDSMTTLVSWFTLLHAKFYQGIDFSTHKELENEVLTRMALLLKDQNQKFGDTLEKFVQINISAEYLASTKILKDSPDRKSSKSFKTFVFTLTFNVRFMRTLLEVILPELEDLAIGEDIPNSSSQKPRDRITVTCRRVLPALRQYSVWITTRFTHLLDCVVGASPNNSADTLRPLIIDLWKSHAAVLTKLLDYFNGTELKSSPYLLEEDEATVGFKPFNSRSIPPECKMHTDANGIAKPRFTDPGIKRNHPNNEMQSRVHDMLIIGYKLQENEIYPLTFDSRDGTFFFNEAALTNVLVPSPRYSSSSSHRAFTPPRLPSIAEPILQVPQGPAKGNGGRMTDSQDNWETEMQSMVQSLVDGKVSGRGQNIFNSSNESYGMHSETAHEVFGQLGSTGTHPQVRQSTPKHLPSIPGFNGAFTPKPYELPPVSPDRLTSFATSEQRETAARELERITGYVHHQSWNPPNGPLASAMPQPFSPMPSFPSTNFSITSSFDASTPLKQQNMQSLPAQSSWNRNNSTIYPGATNFETETTLRSSPWTKGKPGFGTPFARTPTSGQGQSKGD